MLNSQLLSKSMFSTLIQAILKSISNCKFYCEAGMAGYAKKYMLLRPQKKLPALLRYRVCHQQF